MNYKPEIRSNKIQSIKNTQQSLVLNYSTFMQKSDQIILQNSLHIHISYLTFTLNFFLQCMIGSKIQKFKCAPIFIKHYEIEVL